MSKEYLEALERIKNKFINFFHEDNPDVESVEDALQRLESIDNANSSEALESLQQLAEMADNCWVSCDVHKWKNTIKQALIKAQEQEKVLSIIKEKNVDIKLLKLSTTWLDYYTRVKHKTGYDTELTQEEFELLKRWLG